MKEKIVLARNEVKERGETQLMYCPDLNEDDLTKENGKAALDLFDRVLKDYKNPDISVLDDFTSKLALQMKNKGQTSKRVLISVIYSRRYMISTFCVMLIVETLDLGGKDEKLDEFQKQQKIPTPTSLADNTLKKLHKLREENKVVQVVDSDEEEEDSDEEEILIPKKKETSKTNENSTTTKNLSKQEEDKIEIPKKVSKKVDEEKTEPKNKEEENFQNSKSKVEEISESSVVCARKTCGKIEKDVKFQVCGNCKKKTKIRCILFSRMSSCRLKS